MIKIDKTITVDGEDTQTLSNICEIFRIALKEHKKVMDGNPGCMVAPLLSWRSEELRAMEQFMDTIFEGNE